MTALDEEALSILEAVIQDASHAVQQHPTADTIKYNVKDALEDTVSEPSLIREL
jgi:hypothetical protein